MSRLPPPKTHPVLTDLPIYNPQPQQEMGSQITATDNSGNTVLHNAARNNKLWAMHYLVESAKWGMDENNLKTFLYVSGQWE